MSSQPVSASTTLSEMIVGRIRAFLMTCTMSMDLGDEFLDKIKNGTFENDDYKIVKAACSSSAYKKFKKNMSLLETVREGEIFSNGAKDKRQRLPARHRDQDYFEAVEEHTAQCNPNGGFLAGSRLHWRPVEDEERSGDSHLERAVKRKRIARPDSED